MQKYVVRNVKDNDDPFDGGKPLYWNNEYGWVTYGPTVFSEEESMTFDLPDDGYWEKHGLDITLVGEVDPFFVAVYSVSRNYGGPEEGGWWYDAGELIKVVVCSNLDEAVSTKKELAEAYPDTGKRYSVLGGDDYDIFIEQSIFPLSFFPEETPRYS